MAYRQRALQLGAARNACLSRAADAWRRGDGALAKRFSREGHELNAKMAVEMAGAAGKLVRERAKVAEQAVRARDAGWSDDPGDRSSRGNVCGGGLGVCLGIASRDVGDGKMSAEERMECVLDLHGLHSNEATEVLEEFLLAVSFLDFFFSWGYYMLTFILWYSWKRSTITAWVSCCSPYTSTHSHDLSQPTPSLARRSTLVRKMPLAVPHALVWPRASASGCTGGDTPGASEMASSASIR
jgi:hypothetical protein